MLGGRTITSQSYKTAGGGSCYQRNRSGLEAGASPEQDYSSQNACFDLASRTPLFTNKGPVLSGAVGNDTSGGQVLCGVVMVERLTLEARSKRNPAGRKLLK